MGKGGRKIQPAGPHSRKSSQVDTNSSPPSQSQSNTGSSSPSYAQSTKSPKSKYPPKSPPKQPTPSKVRSFSPGREKFEELIEFKKRLDQERKSSQPGPSRSTPSSPKQPRTIRPPTTPPQRSMPPPSMTTLKLSKNGPPSAAVRFATRKTFTTS